MAVVFGQGLKKVAGPCPPKMVYRYVQAPICGARYPYLKTDLAQFKFRNGAPVGHVCQGVDHMVR